jgi:hypothetical protein
MSSKDAKVGVEFGEADEQEAKEQGSEDPEGWTEELELAYYAVGAYVGWSEDVESDPVSIGHQADRLEYLARIVAKRMRQDAHDIRAGSTKEFFIDSVRMR